jgi:membrane associated rhomboid family serine protease
MALKEEKQKLIRSTFVPALLVVLMWLVKLSETIFSYRLSFLGISPLSPEGLPGILLAPFLHGDWNHLMANTVPMFVLGSALFYFYRPIAYRVLLLSTLLTGLWVWLGAREATHIGASGVIYGLSAFLMVSGLIRRHPRLMALSMVVVFLYGGMIWGVFPELFPEKNISWESHLAGLVAGLILAIYYKAEGPQKPKYSWDYEEEAIELAEIEQESESSTQNHTAKGQDAYWNIPEPDKDELTVVYRYRKKT